MSVRITQEPAEVLANPTTSQARITQAPAEVLAAPTTGRARITQIAVEVLVGAKMGFPVMSPGFFPSIILSGATRRKLPR